MTSDRLKSKGVARLIAFVVAAAAALTFAGPASAVVFRDPTGDSGAAPDVASLTVTNDASARIVFRFALANRPNGLELSDSAFDVVSFSLNSDRNAATGDADGDDYLIQLARERFSVARWGGSAYATLATANARMTRSGATVTFTIASGNLGATRAFDVAVASVRIVAGGFATGEIAPDTGRWTYTLVRYCVAPNVTGKTLAAAKRAIRAAGCAVGKVARRAATAKKGRVVAQSPKAGTTRPRGAKVSLVVSRGKSSTRR
jgi:hypothetical protein